MSNIDFNDPDIEKLLIIQMFSNLGLVLIVVLLLLSNQS